VFLQAQYKATTTTTTTTSNGKANGEAGSNRWMRFLSSTVFLFILFFLYCRVQGKQSKAKQISNRCAVTSAVVALLFAQKVRRMEEQTTTE